MQVDMHYWGTYALARMAGIPWADATTIAYAAQYVDDARVSDIDGHDDGGYLSTCATVKTLGGAVMDSALSPDEHRLSWVPFHFLPGAKGETLEQRLLCVKNSDVARESLDHNLNKALSDCPYALDLMGVTAHVYMDTFSHYGFSGCCSRLNDVDGSSIGLTIHDKATRKHVADRAAAFVKKYLDIARSFAGEKGAVSLGHGAVATYPDRPFLAWEFKFEHSRPDNGKVSKRSNVCDYLEACALTHGFFLGFAQNHYAASKPVAFEDGKGKIKEILSAEGEKASRIESWKKAIESGGLYERSPDEPELPSHDPALWDDNVDRFRNLPQSSAVIDTPGFRFHQAATFHRDHVLRDLLPKHQIVFC